MGIRKKSLVFVKLTPGRLKRNIQKKLNIFVFTFLISVLRQNL